MLAFTKCAGAVRLEVAVRSGDLICVSLCSVAWDAWNCKLPVNNILLVSWLHLEGSCDPRTLGLCHIFEMVVTSNCDRDWGINANKSMRALKMAQGRRVYKNKSCGHIEKMKICRWLSSEHKWDEKAHSFFWWGPYSREEMLYRVP